MGVDDRGPVDGRALRHLRAAKKPLSRPRRRAEPARRRSRRGAGHGEASDRRNGLAREHQDCLWWCLRDVPAGSQGSLRLVVVRDKHRP